MEPIEFWAIVGKVQTMADGGIRVYLDLPEQAIMAAAELMACKQAGQVLKVTCEEHKADDDGEAGKGRKLHI